MQSRAPDRLPRTWLAALGIAALLVYGILTPPVAGDGDSGELTIVLARAALAHPTGYPLWTLLGHAFCLAARALGASWELAAGWWSAAGGALAVAFFAALSDRLVGDRPLPRRARLLFVLAPATIFALNPMISFEATHAEVYSWHLAWVLGAGVLFLDCDRALRERADAGGFRRLAILWGLVCGAGMAHHHTALFFAAPMSAVLVWRLLAARPRRLAPIAWCAAAAVVPLLAYAFVFWRAAHPSGADWHLFEPTFDGAVEHVRAASYRTWVFGTFNPSDIQWTFLGTWIYPWLFPGLVLLAGAALAGARPPERLAAWALLAGAVANLAFAWRTRVSDPASYFLAPLAVGWTGAAPVAAALAGRFAPRAAASVAAALAAVAVAVGISWFRTGLDRRAVMIDADARISRMWASIPRGPGIVFWNNDMYHHLRLRQLLRGEKPEIGVWYAAGLGAPLSRARFRERHGVDPLEDLPGPTPGGDLAEFFKTIHRNVNRQTKLPVYEFEPARESVRLLRKPAPAESR